MKVVLPLPPSTTNGVSSHRFRAWRRDSLIPSSSSPSSSSSRISPAVLFAIVVLALIFFLSGLLHLLVRFLLRTRPSSAAAAASPMRTRRARLPGDPGTLQRQLQQLFHIHDSGLDQAHIDALPLFLYAEILGSKDPFDCAVCLAEFAPEDKLRLLPACGHAFHLACIDTWLLSNSSCPLCRGLIFSQGIAIENPMFGFDDPTADEEEFQEVQEAKERMLSVRLGKFKKLSCGDTDGAAEITDRGETSSSNLDGRRCFSMGSYQYVVADANLRVDLTASSTRGRRTTGNAMSRDESLSVSKIWQWSDKNGKFPVSADTAAAFDRGLPWITPCVEEA
ncbi:RING-H2 finger protein ATL46-like [Zingiber officinale]|uniref:RING-H2 finger protein ATL46-like n=1 Tax=Zingiber officinale TaxID=94328 RepID=UPI001C4BA93B|nr:RING-H2 finger protein ATL46-like [Zingiber officinale]